MVTIYTMIVACHRGEAMSVDATVAPEEARDHVEPSSLRVEDALGGDEPVVSAPPGMALVPGGTFWMGADAGGEQDEHPAHPVTLGPFFLDLTPVTNASYAGCVEAHACRPNDRTIASRTERGDDAVFTAPNHPVDGVSWDDAHAYCAWVGKRLPSEAEYERAMRGDDGRRYAWGSAPPDHERTVFGRGATEDVGTHPAGRGPYGHDDLAGNVWEWCEDLYDPYAYRRGSPAGCPEILAALAELREAGLQGFTGSNPIPTECEHVLRGGGYNYDAWGLRATNRVHHPGRFRLLMAGFRCAMPSTFPPR